MALTGISWAWTRNLWHRPYLPCSSEI